MGRLVVADATTSGGDFGSVEDIVVIENKLKNSTALTTPQTNALKQSSYEVRSVNKTSEFNSTNQLSNGDLLEFDGNINGIKFMTRTQVM